MALALLLLGSRIKELMVAISPLPQGHRNPGQALGLPASLPQARGISSEVQLWEAVLMFSGVRMGGSLQVTQSKDSPRVSGRARPGSPAGM